MAVARTLETKGIYARFSETLGCGVRGGNAIRFVFEYPTALSAPPISGPRENAEKQRRKVGELRRP
jgi:hypothetical protein